LILIGHLTDKAAISDRFAGTNAVTCQARNHRGEKNTKKKIGKNRKYRLCPLFSEVPGVAELEEEGAVGLGQRDSVITEIVIAIAQE